MIRRAVPADCDAFPAVERDAAKSFEIFPHLFWIADEAVRDAKAWRGLVAQGLSLVAERDAQIAGFIVASRQDGHVHIDELSVRRIYHRQGIGRDLLLTAIDRARVDGAMAVTLTTFRNVPWNAPFYARHGFGIIADDDAPGHVRAARDHERAAGLADADRCAMLLPL